MSAEGKKKRGVSGASNAKTQPYRLGGGGVHPDHLARAMRTVPGMIDKCGRPREGSAFDKRPLGVSYDEACRQEGRKG